MSTANTIMAATAVIMLLIILRDFLIFQQRYYSKRVRAVTPRNRGEDRARKKQRKAERTRRRVARRRK